jgi:branched-chain amino acid transport system substrate-binding protein
VFNNNQLGIQNFYVSEVVKDGQGGFTYKVLSTSMKDAQDAYHMQCPMK